MHVGVAQQQLWPAIGGGEWTIFQTAKAVAESGIRVTVFTTDVLDLRRGTRIAQKEERVGLLRVVRQHGYPIGPNLVITPGLPLALRRAKLDLIHAHGFGYLHAEVSALIARLKEVPLVLSTHGFFPLTKAISPALGRLYVSVARANLLRYASRVVVDSEAERQIYSELCDPRKITILPLESLSRAEVLASHDPGLFRSQFGLSEPYFLCLGRITESKGFQNVVNAIPEFQRSAGSRAARFVFMGPDWGYLDGLRSLVRRSNLEPVVMITGPVDQSTKLAAIAGSVAVVVPSFYETYGGVVTEAMAMGVPVVATKFGGMTPRLTDGTNGRLIDPRSPAEVVSGLIWALTLTESSRAQLSRFSRDRVLAGYTIEATIAKLIDLYTELAAPSGR